MESPIAYLPTDRRLALARGVDLPEHSQGAALFADISGFTPLTEALVRALGPQRGAEELPRQLNLVYDALIAETDRYGGSVLGFSGDAITCWFEGGGPEGGAAARAAACALAIQRAMGQFARIEIPGAGVVSLAIKVAVTAGPARRFLVGDPALQLIDVLAGETIARLATAEHLAERGDVVVDEACMSELGGAAELSGWRLDHESGERFAVLSGLAGPVAPRPWPERDSVALDDAQIRPWLLAPVHSRLQSGLGEFLTELRPAVALFLRFGGIDYDRDEAAGSTLDSYITWVMGVLQRYGGYLLQLTVGDKGSYFYAAFGAPLSHEDNAARALGAALALLHMPAELAARISVQIGVSQGRMRTGAYGGVTRRTYGVLGDDVNMAARLMQQAPPGQIYVSATARQASGDAFVWGNLPPLQLKGKSEPVSAYRLLAAQERPSIRLQEVKYRLPMVGRQAELAQISRQLAPVLRGRGRIIGVSADAGMGKSRMLTELVGLARQRQIVTYDGECQSFGTNTSYLVWQNIWRAFFKLSAAMPAEEQIHALAQELALISPALLPRMPLLGAVVNLSIPDSELTASFDARLRKESLASLLVECLRARSREMPLLLVLEDCHWIDPLSHDLLEVIGRAIEELPVLIAVAYRPPQVTKLGALRVVQLPHFVEVALGSLSEPEIAELVQAKLSQIYGGAVALQPGFVEQIGARAQGNPFYIEELINYLRDRNVDPQQTEALQQIDLPASLHSLILSRIDQLSENQKTLLKVASVIGRLFRVAILWGVYHQFGNQDRILSDLEVLADLELTPLDTPEPELTYFFKQILTQEVAYETLPFATRATLHERIGQQIEVFYADSLDQHLDLLAFHFDHSENVAKRREYLLRAGEAAQVAYANAAALSYYERALPLLDDPERCAVILKICQVLETTGRWAEAEQYAHAALYIAEQLGDRAIQAQAQVTIGELRRRQGEYAEAQARYGQAEALAAQIGDRAAMAKALICAGTLAAQQGDFAAAQERYRQSLALRRQLNDLQNASNVLNNMSIVASFQGDLTTARALQEESLAIRRSLGNPWLIANSLNNLGMVATDQEEYGLASASLEEALEFHRQIGDPSALATTLHTLANLRRTQGDYERALALYRESMETNRRLGDRWMLVQLLEDVGTLLAMRADYAEAILLAGAADAARAALGAPLPPAEQARLEAALAPARAALGPQAQAAWGAGAALSLDQALERIA